MNNGNNFRFDLWLYNEMKKRGWNLFDLEYYSGVSRSSIEGYINKRRNPTLSSFARILAAFGKHIEIVDD